jgi:hypothetical protein
MDSTIITTDFITDCFQCALKGSKSEIVVCFATISIAAVIRFIEKRRISKKQK